MTGSKLSEDRDEKEQEQWYERTLYQVLLFAGGIAVFGFVLWAVLAWYINPQDSTQKKDLVQALGLITAGAAGAVGILFTWRGQRLTQESLKDARENTQENLRITREGQITERFTRAIDQLGKVEDGKKLFEIRIGGIYALERIARESAEDYWPIMEILTAYVRQNAPWPPRGSPEGRAAGSRSEEDSRGKSDPTEVQAPDPDIQAITAVLRRRGRDFLHRGPTREPERLHLYNTNLSGTDFFGASLRGANLWDSNLSGADLEADLAWAHLQRTDLSEAILAGANLSEADLSWANLKGANLERANLSSADPDLESEYGEDFSAGGEGANLEGADLSAATLEGADLRGAKLWGAILAQANLSRANFEGADLLRANLSGANLSEATITQAQLGTAIGDENTQLPNDRERPEHWSAKTNEQPEEG